MPVTAATRNSLSQEKLNRPTRYGYRRTPVKHWGELIPGDNVLVTGPHPQQRYTGTVDAALEDGSVVWLILAEGAGRRLFLESDGHQITVDPNRHQTLTKITV
jgi:hypothetical protein